MTFSFHYQKTVQNSKARVGIISTPHGIIQTPAFIFCGTKAAIKAVSPLQMQECGTQIILSNTYHLMLQPNSETIQQLGGLHKFMGWSGPILTDSGGFQIFSLGHGSVGQEIKAKKIFSAARNKSLLKITEEGAIFKSYLDGSIHLLTPEKSIKIQNNLGADLILVLDECTPFHVEKSYTRSSMEMSHRWAIRSNQEFERNNNGVQSLYGIVQGGIYEDLRKESCDFVNSQDFFGHAIGGSLGADKKQMADVISFTTKNLNPERPVHLLGIGGIIDIFHGVENGIDTFDCVHPTRLARHGGALIKNKKEYINLKNSRFKSNSLAIEEECDCYTCTNFSKGYLHHLIKAKEPLALQLITIHNVRFMNRLMEAIRTHLKSGLSLELLKKEWLS